MTIRIPAEWELHDFCWMAWAVHREWGKAVQKVKRELSEVVRTIARYEPVRLLAPHTAVGEARREFSDCSNVSVIKAEVDDIWMRDIAPTFALRSRGNCREVVGIDWNFNSWGMTRPPRRGDRLATLAPSIFDVPRIQAGFVAEGGAFATDGRGTLVTTRSCLLNPNRNRVRRGIDRQQLIEYEVRKFGVRKVIWLEGDPCESVTSGHVDGYVLLAPSGVALIEYYNDNEVELPMWRTHDIALLGNTVQSHGRRMIVRCVRPPRPRYLKTDQTEAFAASYLNAYVANGAVIGACFGDPDRDAAARRALAQAFPLRDVIMLRIDTIASGGGGVHCLTQPMVATHRKSKVSKHAS
jgi:agmatine deiminase